MTIRAEHIVAAIGYQNNLHDPESDAYRLNNPLLVRSFGRPGKHEIDEQGRRVFESLVSGYRACLFDVILKVQGKSRAKLKPEDTLENLLGTYGIKGAASVDHVIKFLRRALADTKINPQTKLQYFNEDSTEISGEI